MHICFLKWSNLTLTRISLEELKCSCKMSWIRNTGPSGNYGTWSWSRVGRDLTGGEEWVWCEWAVMETGFGKDHSGSVTSSEFFLGVITYGYCSVEYGTWFWSRVGLDLTRGEEWAWCEWLSPLAPAPQTPPGSDCAQPTENKHITMITYPLFMLLFHVNLTVRTVPFLLPTTQDVLYQP